MTDPLLLEALGRFQELLASAQAGNLKEPYAMALGTADSRGHPSVRMVLLRGHDPRGFVFYTNRESRKGEDLRENPRAALCFFWDPLAEQIRVEGNVEFASVDENDTYWRSRPRMSQIASAASDQSRRLDARATYLRRAEELDRRLADREIPRPPHWIGYRVVPDRIEFWSGREARMHDRVVYVRTADGWKKDLLYP